MRGQECHDCAALFRSSVRRVDAAQIGWMHQPPAARRAAPTARPAAVFLGVKFVTMVCGRVYKSVCSFHLFREV